MAPSSSEPIKQQLVLTLAFGTAASVATIYLNQPLLPLLGRELQATPHTTGLLVTLTQIGYGIGIIGLVPLGDVVNKKKLILGKLAVLFVALIAAGLAPNMAALLLAHIVIGVFSTAAQDFVPLAADLAPAQRRGQVIGMVMGGLLLGILVSRTFSGLIAQQFGWRAVFFSSAVVIAGIIALVATLVPSHPTASRASYGELMISTVKLLRTYPVLGLVTATQGMLGLVFSAFWTVLAFRLSGEPFHLTTAQIGCFGLAGAFGALGAPFAGKLADRRGPFFNIPIAIGLTFVSFVAMSLFPASLVALILGTVLFDLGVQMSMVSHQSIVYALNPAARSRMNGILVGGLFTFFALGSFAGNALFLRFGWQGLTSFCLTSCAGAYALHRWTRRVRDDHGSK